MILKLFLERLHGRVAYKGSVIIMTLMLIVLLTIEVATISLVGIRSLSQEGVLRGQNSSARRATEIAMQRLETTLYQDARSGTAMSALFDKYKLAGSVTTYSTASTLAVLNPETGASDTTSSNTQLSSWVQERRGNYFHLVGRAQTGGVDLLSHKWVLINPCFASGSGTLVTILPGNTTEPGLMSTAVTSTGRVYFGTGGFPTQFYTWHPSSQVLSTLLPSAVEAPGYQSTVVGGERVFFSNGVNPTKIWTWEPSSRRLSTLIGTANYLGSLAIDATSGGRVYFGEYSPTGNFYTWDASSNVLSTLMPSGTFAPGNWSTEIASDGRVYWGTTEFDLQNFYTWSPISNILSTILPATVYAPGSGGIGIDNSGRVFFGNQSTGSRFRTYSPTSNVLSTVLPGNVRNAGYFSTVATPSGRAYFGLEDSPGPFWTYDSISNILSTILPAGGANNAGEFAIALGPNDSVYFGQNSTGAHMRYYNPSTRILSTITPSSVSYPGVLSMKVASDGRLYFGQGSTAGNIRTWDPTTNVLSTLLPSTIDYPGYGADWPLPQQPSIDIAANGRVFFGQDANPGNFYTWDPSTNVLSTLASGLNKPGRKSTVAVNTPTTGVYFGTTGSGRFYYWYQQSTCNTRGY